MIKVLLADDEILVRVGIKSSIAWNEYGFELVGEASNGLEAWDLIEQTEPDILITDIQMPKLDGMGLLARIKESGRDISTIILTCHSDFEYAKQAIRFGVRDYVLKLSTTPDELLSILLELRTELLAKAPTAPTHNALINQRELRRLFAHRLQMGHLSAPGALREQIRELSLALQPHDLLAIRLHVDKPSTVPPQDSTPSCALSTPELCSNILEEWVRKNKNSELFSLEDGDFLILMNPPTDIRQIAPDLQYLFNKYLNLSVSIGISDVHMETEGQKAYEEATEALKQRFFNGSGRSSFYAESLCRTGEVATYGYSVENELLEQLSRMDVSQVEALLFPLITEICSVSITKEQCMERLSEVLSTFFQAAKRFGGTRQEFCQEYELSTDSLHELEFSSEVIPWFAELIPHFFDYLTRCRNRQYRSEILLIQDYIRQHYREKITLDFAAAYVFMSPSHFCKLFKKSTGKNFVDYLSEVRIEKAKRLLLESNLLIYQISEQVGYTNFNYFTKVFKKYTGITPEEYRQIGGGADRT